LKKRTRGKYYKYLGTEESFDIQRTNEKETLKKEYLRGLRLVLGTELCAKNKIHAVGSVALPVLRYCFGIVNWHQEELQKLDRITNHSWTASPKGRCRLLVCSQKTGRKGPDAVRSSPCSRNYKTDGICRQEGRLTNTGCQNTPTQHLLSSVQTARCLKTEVQRETRKMRDSIAEKTKERWHGKRVHVHLPRNLDEKLVDIEQSHRWLKSGDMGETESTIVAAQDQTIGTNYFKNKILKQEIESKCRLCKQHEEAIDHLISGCPILAKCEYEMRHDLVCTHMHYSICKALGIETTDKWYTRMPKTVFEEGDVTVLRNQAVYTDSEVAANRPDVIIKNKEEKICTLIDVAVPADINAVKKGSGKKVKIQEFMNRDTTNVEPEMYDYTSNNWSHWNSN